MESAIRHPSVPNGSPLRGLCKNFLKCLNAIFSLHLIASFHPWMLCCIHLQACTTVTLWKWLHFIIDSPCRNNRYSKTSSKLRLGKTFNLQCLHSLKEGKTNIFQKHCRKFKPVNLQFFIIWKTLLQQEAIGSCSDNRKYSALHICLTAFCYRHGKRFLKMYFCKVNM